MRQKSNSLLAFRYGMIALIAIFICVIVATIQVKFPNELLSIVIGILVFAFGISAIIGVGYSLNSLREPNSSKKIIGAIINFGLALIFIAAIVANVMDMYKAFR